MLTIIAGRLRVVASVRGVGEPLEFLIVRNVELARLKKLTARLDESRRIIAYCAQQAAKLQLFN
jgi:hypothetical protein